VNIWIEVYEAGISPVAATKQLEKRAAIAHRHSVLRISVKPGREQNDSVAFLPVFIQSP
jgi:hypothetical protein